MSDFDIRKFIDEYFEDNDSRLMQQLDETIGGSEEPTEISALADLVFRDYIADAFSEAIKENNKYILSKVKEIVEENSFNSMKKENYSKILEIPQELKEELNLDD